MIGRTNILTSENFERFHRSKLNKIEDKAKLSRTSASEGAHQRQLGFTTKIILLIFTTANDNPNLGHRLLMAFSDLEKRKQKNCREKTLPWPARQH